MNELFMKKYIPNLPLLLIFALLMVLSVGCTQEVMQEMDNDVKLVYKISTRSFIGQTIDGVTIQTVRVIAVAPALGNQIVVNKLVSSQDDEPSGLTFSLQEGTYKICVVGNETSAMTPLLSEAVTLSQLNSIMVVTPTTEADLVLHQSVDIRLRPQSANPQNAEVSVDGGTWISPPTINLNLVRVASKISLSIRKLTTNPADRFDIKKVELINLPSASYLLPGRAYTGSLHNEVPFDGLPAVAFSNNDQVEAIFSDYIVSEYQLTVPSSPDTAPAFVITASYTRSGGLGQDVQYIVPVLGQNATDYGLARNTHYRVTATITQSAVIDYPLFVEYEVSKWDIAGDGSFGAGEITSSGKWMDGTDVNNRQLLVANNTSVTYEFTLSFPPGATWTAQLSNFLDFEFDLTGGAVRNGVAAEGVVYKVKVTPRRAVYTNNVATEFYITVNNGIENVELDLTQDGSNQRFIIKQIPN